MRKIICLVLASLVVTPVVALTCDKASADTRRFSENQLTPTVPSTLQPPPVLTDWGDGTSNWVFGPSSAALVLNLDDTFDGCTINSIRPKLSRLGSYSAMLFRLWNYAAPVTYLGGFQSSYWPWAGVETDSYAINSTISAGGDGKLFIQGTDYGHVLFWVDIDYTCQ